MQCLTSPSPPSIDPGLPSQFYFIRDKLLSKRERRGISARLAHNPQLFCALLQLLRTGDMTYHNMMLLRYRKGGKVSVRCGHMLHT